MVITMNDYFNDGGYQEPPRERGPRRAEEPYSYQFSDYEGVGGAGKPPKKGKRGLIVFASILAAVVVLSLVSFTGYGVYVMMTGDNFLHEEAPSAASSEAAAPRDMPQMDIAAAPSSPGAGQDADGGLTTEAIAAKVSPSAVRITAYQAGSQYGVAGGGTGIVLSEDGYIVTNAHVIENAAGLTITLLDEGESYNAVVVGQDTVTDLAVVRLEADPMPSLTPAEFGDSDALRLGERVVAIGNAGGNRFSGSVTSGIISGLNRQITNSKGTSLTVLQTDAAINPGNSGGALLNMNGELIGINSVKVASSSVEGMGYAIPISDVQSIIEELMLKETRDVVSEDKRGYLGINPIDVTNEIYETYGMPVGVYVNIVYEDSPAEASGLVKGNIITKFDGQTVKTREQLTSLLSYYSAGETVEIVAMVQSDNGYVEKTFQVILGTKDVFGEDANSGQSAPKQQESENDVDDFFNNPFGSFWSFP